MSLGSFLIVMTMPMTSWENHQSHLVQEKTGMMVLVVVDVVFA
jgi:hypothetical protein